MRTQILFLRFSLLLVVLAVLCQCAPEAAPVTPKASPTVVAAVANTPAPTQTAAPTATMEPTATSLPWTFRPDSEIAGVPVEGLTSAAAYNKVSAALSVYRRPLQLRIGRQVATLVTADLVTLPDVDKLIERGTAMGQQQAVKLPLQTEVDRDELAARLDRIFDGIEQAFVTEVITNAEALTQTYTFAAQPGVSVDRAKALEQIEPALTDPTVTSVTLQTTTTLPTRPPLAELQPVLEEHAKYWRGIAGFYVRDLETGEEIGYNADTVFSGASVMKVPIMIFTYSRLGSLNEQQREWLRLVIDKSENIEANNLLAAAVGGVGTEDALVGVNEMSEWLRDLGLQHTYTLIPYESGEWLILNSRLPQGAPQGEGKPPYTFADPYLRTTPREMAQVFIMLDECAQGKGQLIEKYGERLNQENCQEMIRALQSPHDQERMVAGIPAGVPVAHKGGWTTDFQGDIGIVESPGGRYVAAIYIYLADEVGYVTNHLATPSPYLADFSHTIYTFFNPEPLEQVRARQAEEAKEE